VTECFISDAGRIFSDIKSHYDMIIKDTVNIFSKTMYPDCLCLLEKKCTHYHKHLGNTILNAMIKRISIEYSPSSVDSGVIMPFSGGELHAMNTYLTLSPWDWLLYLWVLPNE
jgi:hypothetical protein